MQKQTKEEKELKDDKLRQELIKDLTNDVQFLELDKVGILYRACRTMIAGLQNYHVDKVKDLASTYQDKWIRNFIWMHHGCNHMALYGDDGEMSCGGCRFDFRRASFTDIIKHIEKSQTKRMLENVLLINELFGTNNNDEQKSTAP